MSVPAALDHLVYAAPDLDQASDRIEALLGVRPAKGGSHPGFGTRNALLSLGDSFYLEILAPDPELPAPARGRWTDQAPEGGGLMTWVLRSDAIEQTAQTARDAGGGIGAIVPGERTLPDGSLLRWKLTNPYAMPFGGAVPFLIDWGDSPHPAQANPAGGTLVGFDIAHPDAASLRRVFAAIGADVAVSNGREPRLSATIETPRGLVVLS